MEKQSSISLYLTLQREQRYFKVATHTLCCDSSLLNSDRLLSNEVYQWGVIGHENMSTHSYQTRKKAIVINSSLTTFSQMYVIASHTPRWVIVSDYYINSEYTTIYCSCLIPHIKRLNGMFIAGRNNTMKEKSSSSADTEDKQCRL